ncbi:ABC transporter permease [Nitratireductor sp. GISD-1A_MAKvit]|uniref:ABC transporter permease n=1 Tax=Nitratireductor sp. GISD-1A_MAKvit TaxID=3234198 RepID=UPI003465E44C
MSTSGVSAPPSSFSPSLAARLRLLGLLAWRDITSRYRGSMMGLVWSFVTPVLLLGVYTVVFSGIFRARVSAGSGSAADFALQLFAGLIVHGLAAEVLSRAPGLIAGNTGYVKKVMFPLEILPLVLILSAVFHGIISVVILMIFQLFVHQHIAPTIIFVPLVLLPYMIFLAGISWLVSAAGVFIRDISQITGFVITLLLFLSPVFYPASTLPEQWQFVLILNPLTIVIEQMRAVVLYGELPHFLALFVFTLISLLVFWAGLFSFSKLKREFADVL